MEKKIAQQKFHDFVLSGMDSKTTYQLPHASFIRWVPLPNPSVMCKMYIFGKEVSNKSCSSRNINITYLRFLKRVGS